MSVRDYQQAFIRLAIAHKVLCFGKFTLKSGRISPYFFNAGRFYTGGALSALGKFYAQALLGSNIAFDMLFGPAYKGIPLATSLSVALAEHHQLDVPVCYNRKEVKDHGEGGLLVGAPLAGRVVIVDDVITAGTAIREVVAIMQSTNARPTAVIIGLDRQERGAGSLSAVQEMQREYAIPVISIIKLNDIIEYIQQWLTPENSGSETVAAAINPAALLDDLLAYRKVYGV